MFNKVLLNLYKKLQCVYTNLVIIQPNRSFSNFLIAIKSLSHISMIDIYIMLWCLRFITNFSKHIVMLPCRTSHKSIRTTSRPNSATFGRASKKATRQFPSLTHCLINSRTLYGVIQPKIIPVKSSTG